MPPTVIDVQRSADVRDVVHRAVQALVEGGLVVFPTETVYGVAASALHPEAVECLISAKSRDEKQPFALCVKSAEDAWDYVPSVSPLGRRLARRCWPGPVTLVIPDNHPDSLLRRLPESVQKVVASTGSLGLRVPAHQLVLDVLDMLAGPIVLTSANRSGQPPAVTAEQAVAALGDDTALVLDDGECRFGQASTVVRIDPSGLTVLREGFVSEQTIHRLAAFMVVLVCTGNTCRSPMAEVMLRKLLAEKLGCEMDQLEDRGVTIMSAGIAAMSGSRASAESVEVARRKGLKLDDHVSQPVTDRLVRHADLIFTMTRGHRAGLLSHWPSAANRTHLLSRDGQDVSDPIGGPLGLYQRCSEQIEQALIERVNELDLTQILSNPPIRERWRRMKVAMGSDHHGVQLRATLAAQLTSQGHTVEDKGTCSTEAADYPDIAQAVAGAVTRGEVDRGILICGSGIGMSMAANKVAGIRAVACYDERLANMSRRHNDANVLCLSDDLVGTGRNARIVEIWMTTDFEGGRHQRRLDKIADLER